MELCDIRQEIDRLDVQLKELFLKRMDLSGQVAAEKKRTGGAVYVPGREQEILDARSQGVRQEYLPECQAFFRKLMEISRTYQYAEMADRTDKLNGLPKGRGAVVLEVSTPPNAQRLASCLDAAILAGLQADVDVGSKGADERTLQLRISGDFSQELAKGAVLQMLEENSDIRIQDSLAE